MTTTDIEALEQHLLYHKALAESPEEVERINGYLTTLNSAVDGTKLADPVDEVAYSQALAFWGELEKGEEPHNEQTAGSQKEGEGRGEA